VFIRPKKIEGGSPGDRMILVEVEEKLNSEFTFSVGYGSIEKLKASTGLSINNLAGTARQVGIMVEADYLKRGVEGSFTEPRTFNTRIRTDLNLYLRYEVEPSYDVSRYGGRLTFGRKFGKNGDIALRYRHENATLHHVETDVPPEDFKSRVRSIALSYSYDTRDNLFNPTRGWLFQSSYELAGGFLSGTDAFSRVIVDTKWFHLLTRSTVVATSLEVGWMDRFGSSADVPLGERFYTGGPYSIRSFAYHELGPKDENGKPLGGKFEIVWNAIEIRQAVWRWIGAVVFLDAGNVWTSVADFRLSGIRYAPGIGLRTNTPIGIVRLDYGFNVDPKDDEKSAHLYLSMGQAF
jgi:outer membrane protein assembly factor BamA